MEIPASQAVPASVPGVEPKPVETGEAAAKPAGLGQDQLQVRSGQPAMPPLPLMEDLGAYYRAPDEILGDEMERVRTKIKAEPDKREALLAEFQTRLVKQFNLPTPKQNGYRFSADVLKRWIPMVEEQAQVAYNRDYGQLMASALQGREALQKHLESLPESDHDLLLRARDAIGQALQVR